LLSSPKSKAKEGKTSEVDCLICEEPIFEADDRCVGEEVVFCEGRGVSNQAKIADKISKSSFFAQDFKISIKISRF